VTPPDEDQKKSGGDSAPEHPEPCDGFEPVPLWLITLFFGIMFWAGLYLAYFSGGFRADVFNPSQTAWAGGGAAPPVGPVDPKTLGRRVFTRNCVVCHQTTGLGVAGQFPPLAGSEWVLEKDWHGSNHLVKILLKGLQGPVQVKGSTFNNSMPTWALLSDEQISSVLTYIRSEWGNAAPPVPTDYVKKIRAESAARTDPWSQKDLQEIPPEHLPSTPASPASLPAG